MDVKLTQNYLPFQPFGSQVSVCLAYLVSVKQMALADALTYVKSKRPVARPNAGFLKQLLGLELESLGKNSALPEDLLRGKPVLSSSTSR